MVLLITLVPARAFAADIGMALTATRTDSEVRGAWSEFRPSYEGAAFSVTPSIVAPYAPGTAHPAFLADGLGVINFARFLAGVPNDVVLDATRSTDGQYGAVLLAASTFGHNPPKPADMTSDFYTRALSSTTQSNIGYGHADSESFQLSCLADADSGNIATLGHRRWLINPAMLKTGIGFAGGRHTTYAFDRSRAGQLDYSAIAYPSAGPFPVEEGFFGAATPWSVTLNPSRYDWDTTGHQVTLRRVSDGKTWMFNASDTNTSGEFFSANFAGYGVGNAFIFRPDPKSVAYAPGDQFDVTLSGGIYAEGTRTPTTVTYRTRFISLASPAGGVAIEHDAGGVTFGRWVTGHSQAYSGGGYVYSRWADESLQARFTGTRIRWVGPRQPAYGKADVYIDGVRVATVDQYAPASEAELQSVVFESGQLAAGPHTLRIECIGTKSPASTGVIVVLDYLEVEGADGQAAPSRLNEQDPGTTFAGTWIASTNPVYTESTYAYSRWAGTACEVAFTGTRVAWIGPRASTYGIADVYIDGVKVATVDTYRTNRAPQGWREIVWESATLAPSTHTLSIRPTGAKNPAATAANVVVDAIDVTP